MKIIQNLVVVFIISTIALIIIPLPPFILDFIKKLKDIGIEISEEKTLDEIVEEICQSK